MGRSCVCLLFERGGHSQRHDTAILLKRISLVRVSLSVTPNPTVMWAYNTGGPVTGAPILSLDGSQIAYIQQTSSSSKTAQLVLLKWSSPGIRQASLSVSAAC